MNVGLALSVILGGAALVFLLVGVRSAFISRKNPTTASVPRHKSIFNDEKAGTLFLFDGQELVDCSPDARALLAASPYKGNDWIKLVAYLGVYFPGIHARLNQLSEQGRLDISTETPSGVQLTLKAEIRAGLIRISLSNDEDENPETVVDPVIHRTISEELTFQRTMLARAPMLVWHERSNGDVIWANTAYIQKAVDRLTDGEELTWPLPPLFTLPPDTDLETSVTRHMLSMPDGPDSWFDVTVVFEDEGGKEPGRRCYAVCCDTTVRAESTLRDFMQTLTKTFANLPIGLAIFDHQRLLHVFNPALIDLTELTPDVLSRRPSLYAFLDALREKNVIPEPKDYRSWRKQIVQMERAAASGGYEDTWHLSSGRTYKVTGRPHPNGALALMIEDISHEVSRTRRYRADLELGQSVIDSIKEGIVVFSADGTLVMSNDSYAEIWGHNLAEDFSTNAVRSVVRLWQKMSLPNNSWADIEDRICTIGPREPWQQDVFLQDGVVLTCRVVPLAAGATMVGFSQTSVDEKSVLTLPKGKFRARA